MTAYRQDIDFQNFFRRLGHNLEEIRVRALENIISKLEHHLICEQDIIHERHLFIRLLEWFNFTPCVKKEEVLGLLNKLSQHWGAAELIQGIGGIEFLTQLRGDLEARLHPVLDQILENVMRLPDVKTQEHAPECIYHKPTDTGLSGVTVTPGNEGSWSHLSIAMSGSRVASQPSVTADKLGHHDFMSPGYFEDRLNVNSVVAEPRLDLRVDQAMVFKMSTFPWIPLTTTDRHVIVSTNRSLQSKEPNLLISACEFLSDVVFQDFPAEIFIQRPQILNSLVSILNLAPRIDTALVICTARTLSDLCHWLHVRIRFYQDPVIYTPKQEFSSSSPSTHSLTGSSSSRSVHSSDTRPSLIGWGDQRHRGDGDSSDSASRDSSVDIDPSLGHFPSETDIGDIESLHHQQLTLPQFAMTVLEQSLQGLHTLHMDASLELLRLAFEAWKILAVVIRSDIWQSEVKSAHDWIDRVKGCFEMISALLDYHHHNQNAYVKPDRGDPSHHRLVYLGTISLFAHVLHLVPAEKAGEILPERLKVSLGPILFDESLAISYPQCHAVLTHYAQVLGLDDYRHFCQTVHIRQSMQDTCRFIELACTQLTSAAEAASLADNALVSLPYHAHYGLITSFVEFFSHVCSRKSSDKSTLSRCSGTLLKMLSHPVLEIRQNTYHTLLKTVQEKLNPANEANDPKFTGHLESKFIISPDILYEISCFGLADADNKVSSLAQELIYHLLQSRLLLGDMLWSELTSALLKSLPVLQSYADLTTRFGRRIWIMLDPAITSDNLCLLEKLRGNLRLMLSSDSGLRSEVVKRLTWFLTNEIGSIDKMPELSRLDTSLFPNLFIVSSPNYLDTDTNVSVFQVESMKQVFDIFTSHPVDPGVKKSAGDQLAIMLRDPRLHPAFRQYGGMELVLGMLHDAVAKPRGGEQNSLILHIPACVTMLHHLLHFDYTLCHNLSHDSAIYYDLLRVSLQLLKDRNVSNQVSSIFTFLLFDEVAKFDISSSKDGHVDRNFSLPAVVSKRYRLPFQMTVHHTISPNTVLAPPDNDILRTPAPQEMLRVAWNIAWSGGFEEMLELLKSGGTKLQELGQSSKTMELTPIDKVVLMATSLRWGLKEGLYAVANATSHADVISALTRVLMHLSTIPSAECAELLHKLNWNAVLNRFLSVVPSSSQDERLLMEVLQFMNMVLKLSGQVPEEILQWLAERLYSPTGPLFSLLTGGEGDDLSDGAIGTKRTLDKVLLHFIMTFTARLPYKLHKRLSVHQLRGDLCRKMLMRLNVTDGPHFYNLAALEGTLICLMHLTARPGWSSECTELESSALCSQVLNCLLEVVSAFHIGRGGMAMSYMGKGVTKAATLCLRQLAHEIIRTTRDKEWPKNWLYSRLGANAVAEPGLNWMLTLWAYRDPEVRAAGLGITVALTSTEAGRVMVTSNCKHIPGGIWAAAFSVLLDQSECSFVRQQAALLLVNLTSQTIPSSTADAALFSNVWHGPAVIDTESNVSLVGLNALLALLHHSQFYPQLVVMLDAFFPASMLEPVMVTTEVMLHSLDYSQTTVTTSDFNSSQSETQGKSLSSQGLGMFNSLGQDKHASLTSSSTGTVTSELQVDCTPTVAPPGEEEAMSSVVTPCLVGGVCQLLRNLVIMAPQDTLTSLSTYSIVSTLLSMLDTTLLQNLCQQLFQGPHRTSSLLMLRDLLRMYDAIVSLLRTSLMLDTPIRRELLDNTTALKAIASLLLVQCDSAVDLVIECRQLWHSVLLLLCSLLQTQSAAALQCLTQVLSPIWQDFCNALIHVLEVCSAETQDLYLACTMFLSLLLMEEAKQVSKDQNRSSDPSTLAHLLDSSSAKMNSLPENESVHTTGASLCKVLMLTYELSSFGSKTLGQCKLSKDVVHLISTLKALLAVSQSAKTTALDMGLVENLIGNLKQKHGELCLESLQMAKSMKKKEDSIIQELIMTVNILRNFVCGNQQVKMACCHSGLGGTLHKLWAWCLQEPKLMNAVLSLLVTFTVRCPAAADSLAASSSSQVMSNNMSRQQAIGSSLVYSLIKLTQREIEKEVLPSAAASAIPLWTHVKLLFTLFNSLALSAECRHLIGKSNFLQEFSNLSPGHSRKSRSRQMLDALWLDFAVSLSFSLDGQQMLFRINDCLTVLLDFMEHGFGQCQQSALLILRNMCCHGNNKPKLMANDQVIPCCINLVEKAEQGGQLQTLAASALWTLAYKNHKAKVALKNMNIIPRMRACLKNIYNTPDLRKDNTQCSENIELIISTINE